MSKRTQENRITVTANRNYKDRLFRLLFGAEHYKENLLELYNALNHCHYTNVEELEITTIENVIYIGMKNDTSFLLHGHMVLYEHQYTYSLRKMVWNWKLQWKNCLKSLI